MKNLTEKPIITVVISAYNHAQFITKTIISIVQQDYGFNNIDLIVIDDNSKDDTIIILKELKQKYDFRLFENNVQKGITANLNFALSIAAGKFFCLCGSDDYWMKNKLTYQVNYMLINPKATVHSAAALRIDANDNPLPQHLQRKSINTVYHFKEIFLRKFEIVTINAMIKTSVLKRINGFDESVKIEDYSLWLKLAYNNYEIHVTDQCIGYYRIHSNNTINKVNFMYTELKKIIFKYADHPLFDKAYKQLNKVYFPQFARTNKVAALKILPQSISNSKFFYTGLFNLFFPKRLKSLFK
jgi:alpha-1,3-rhamnosyltransferase